MMEVKSYFIAVLLLSKFLSGPTLTHFAAGRKQPARFPGYRAEKSRIFTVIAHKKPVGIRRPAFIDIDFLDQPSIS
jgi:hypothetical protein